jgi:tRNA-modifying protein YgfZ
MSTVSAPVAVGRRPRGFVRVSGPHAAGYLGRMLSNDVEALAPGEACEALLLTPKARVIAPLVAVRRSDDDFLLLTEPELAETVCDLLLGMRFAARAEIEAEAHSSHLLLGEEASPPGGVLAVRTVDYGVPGYEVLDANPPDGVPALDEEALERLRILAGTPRFGREIDDRVLPAEAGLDERAISFTKGCFPGQEPVARLRYRGHVNRRLRVLAIEAREPPPGGTEIVHGERTVGRVTSAARDGGRVLALGYVRTDVPDDAVLAVGGAAATMAPLARP